MARRKNVELRSKIMQLWEKGVRSPSRIARELGVKPSTVKTVMYRMRREGLLPKSDVHGDLLDVALTELKGAEIRLSWLLGELVETKYEESVRRAKEFVEDAIKHVTLYKKMHGLLRQAVKHA